MLTIKEYFDYFFYHNSDEHHAYLALYLSNYSILFLQIHSFVHIYYETTVLDSHLHLDN